MALSASFIADFKSLVEESARAETALTSLEGSGAKATAQFGRMEAAITEAQPPLNDLRTSLTQFDGILASVGINIGPQIRAIQEIGDASGKSATQIGLLGTAGLAVGAALTGWGIGRAVSDFFGLDKAIGDVTASLLGWGSVADEEGAAKADLLARASKIAGIEIYDLGSAMMIASSEAERQAASMDTAAAAAKRLADAAKTAFDVETMAFDVNLDNQRRARAAEDAANEQARRIEEAALLATTKLWDEYFALRVSHGGTANEIAIAQIDRWAADLTAKMHKAGTDTKEFYDGLAAVSHEKMAAVGIDWDLWETKSIPALQETADNALKTYNAMVASGLFFRDELDKQLAKYRELQDVARGYGDSGVDAANRIAEAEKRKNEELQKAKELAEAIVAENRRMGGSFDITRENFSQTARGLGQDPGRIEELLKKGYSFAQAMLWANHPDWPPPENPGPRVPGFAGGVSNFSGGAAIVGERGPELVTLPRGSNVTPLGGASVTVHMYVSGLLDPRTQRELTEGVSDGIIRKLETLGVQLH